MNTINKKNNLNNSIEKEDSIYELLKISRRIYKNIREIIPSSDEIISVIYKYKMNNPELIKLKETQYKIKEKIISKIIKNLKEYNNIENLIVQLGDIKNISGILKFDSNELQSYRYFLFSKGAVGVEILNYLGNRADQYAESFLPDEDYVNYMMYKFKEELQSYLTQTTNLELDIKKKIKEKIENFSKETVEILDTRFLNMTFKPMEFCDQKDFKFFKYWDKNKIEKMEYKKIKNSFEINIKVKDNNTDTSFKLYNFFDALNGNEKVENAETYKLEKKIKNNSEAYERYILIIYSFYNDFFKKYKYNLLYNSNNKFSSEILSNNFIQKYIFLPETIIKIEDYKGLLELDELLKENGRNLIGRNFNKKPYEFINDKILPYFSYYNFRDYLCNTKNFNNQTIRNLNNNLRNRITNLEQAQQNIANRNSQLKTKNSELAKAIKNIANRNSQLKTKKSELAKAIENIANRNSQLETKKSELAKAIENIANKNSELAKAKQNIKNRNSQIKEYKETKLGKLSEFLSKK